MKIRFGYYKSYPIQSPMGRLIAGVFLVLGLLVLLFGGYRSWSYRQIEDQLVGVEAVIERIDVRGRGEDREHDVYVSYTHQGIRYEDIRLSWYSSDMEEGNPLSLKIHPNDPSRVVDDDAWVVLLIGGMFTLMGGVFSVAARWDDLKDRLAARKEELC